MALPVLPSNGFITRLLQQTNPSPAASTPATSDKVTAKPDQTSISDEARQASKSSGNAQESNTQLESKLIELYNQKGQGQG